MRHPDRGTQVDQMLPEQRPVAEPLQQLQYQQSAFVGAQPSGRASTSIERLKFGERSVL